MTPLCMSWRPSIRRGLGLVPFQCQPAAAAREWEMRIVLRSRSSPLAARIHFGLSQDLIRESRSRQTSIPFTTITILPQPCAGVFQCGSTRYLSAGIIPASCYWWEIETFGVYCMGVLDSMCVLRLASCSPILLHYAAYKPCSPARGFWKRKRGCPSDIRACLISQCCKKRVVWMLSSSRCAALFLRDPLPLFGFC